jgi:hypothetical protein
MNNKIESLRLKMELNSRNMKTYLRDVSSWWSACMHYKPSLKHTRSTILPVIMEEMVSTSTVYWTISFKLTGGVWHVTHFTHSTFWQPPNFCVKPRKFQHLNRNFCLYLCFIFIRQFGASVTTWRFERGPSDVWPRPKFLINRGVHDVWLPIWTK